MKTIKNVWYWVMAHTLKRNMIRCKIYVENSAGYHLDDDVSIKIFLPCLPIIGEYLYLNDKDILELQRMAKVDYEIVSRYAPYFFYNKSSLCENVHNSEYYDNLDMEDFSFADLSMSYVKEINLTANSPYVYLTIGTDYSSTEEPK